jgi:hypothetical protein
MPNFRPDSDAFTGQFDRMAGQMPGMARDPQSVRQRVELMEMALEHALVLPGTTHRIGLDAIIGLIPIVGDILTAVMGAWIVWEARNLGMSHWQVARMSANVGIDTLIGAVPLVGDVFDLAFRSNSRNLKIIRKHLDRYHPQTQVIDM